MRYGRPVLPYCLAYCWLAGALRPRCARPPAPARPPLQRHRASHRRLDGPADRGRLPGRLRPSYLLRDRDKIYGHSFRQRVKGMGIDEILTAPHSPWQNPFAERLIGSVRRECLDHVLVLSERHLRRILTRYFVYYHRARTHLSLEKDAPDMRPIQRPEVGAIVGTPEVRGLHHRYARQAA